MKHSITMLALLLCSGVISAQSFQSIEATEWDPTQSRWLVGNGSNILAQDANGDITEFSSGNATHGMEVMNGYLFAIHNTSTTGRIRAYDLTTGDEVMNLTIAGAGFLNGMGSDPATNRLWVSDFSEGEILEINVSDIDNPVYETIVANTGSTPNGVVHDAANNRVVFVNWNNNAAIKQIDLTDNSLSTITSSGLGDCDGIDIDENGDFYISSWSPQRITKFNNDFSESETITSTGLSSPADISYAEEIQTLGVANSFNNTLLLVPLGPLTVEESAVAEISIYPNPTSDYIQFSTSAPLDYCKVFDVDGKLIKDVSNGLQGNDRIDISELPAGTYLVNYSAYGVSFEEKIVVTR